MIQATGLRVALPGPRAGLFGRAAPREVVHGVDLVIPRGCAMGLVGESGSGKTTLGRALVRLLPPSGGSLRFDGIEIAATPVAALRPLQARMQMIFQDPRTALNPRLPIGVILARPLWAFGRLRGAGARRERARELLALVGLPPGFVDRYPHELSGGQLQRVGIARALALEPDFIVADEVVSGLDVSSQARILLLLRDLRRRLGLTLLFISHDLSVVRVLCDRVTVLLQGDVVESGDCATVFSQPSHDYTRALIAAVPLPEVEAGWLSGDAGGAVEPPPRNLKTT
jgi:peptide/nickel transport system ATP-binding protein